MSQDFLKPVSVSEQPYLTNQSVTLVVMWKSYENRQHSPISVGLCTKVDYTQSPHGIKGTAKSQMTWHIYVLSWHLIIWPKIPLVKPVSVAWSFCGSCKNKEASTLGPWQKALCYMVFDCTRQWNTQKLTIVLSFHTKILRKKKPEYEIHILNEHVRMPETTDQEWG